MEWKLSRTIFVIFTTLFFAQALYGVDNCSICTEPLDGQHGEVVCLSCHPTHCFHRDCIVQALNADYQRKCPLCRVQNPVILSLPPEHVSIADRAVRYVKEQVSSGVSAVKERVHRVANDIQQQALSNQTVCGLWHARHAASIGFVSALVGVPCSQGITVSGIVGACKPHADPNVLLSYPGMFYFGYTLARLYTKATTWCMRHWTDIPSTAPLFVHAHWVPLICYAAVNLWRNI